MVDNIYLIGFSGTGKTSTGLELARILGWVFIDMDCMIEKNSGKSILEIFEDEGEDAFRNVESEFLSDISEGHHQVVSTGGGIPIREINRFVMFNSGTVICLTSNIETIYSRLYEQNNEENTSVFRPMLKSEQPRERIAKLMQERLEFYSATNIQIPTDGMTPIEVAFGIKEKLRL